MLSKKKKKFGESLNFIMNCDIYDAFQNSIQSTEPMLTTTFVGNGLSSRKRVITAGPSGSSTGTTSIKHMTTIIQPPCLSAIRFNFSSCVGGS